MNLDRFEGALRSARRNRNSARIQRIAGNKRTAAEKYAMARQWLYVARLIKETESSR